LPALGKLISALQLPSIAALVQAELRGVHCPTSHGDIAFAPATLASHFSGAGAAFGDLSGWVGGCFSPQQQVRLHR